MVTTMIFWLFYTLPRLILSVLQIRYVHSKMGERAVILGAKEYREAGEYAIAKGKIEILETLLAGIVAGIWLLFGLSLLESITASFVSFMPLWLASLLFVLLFLIIPSLIALPLEGYKSLVLDKKFGFSKSNLKLFMLDALKEFALTLLIASPVILALFYIIDHFRFWWLYGFLFAFALVVLTNLLYPTLIAPIFNKFTPLENESLKSSIDELMQRAGFSSSGIFVMDASRRDGRLNAYFGGLGKSKRVVLFDTLLEKVKEHELLAVLGHELGHFKHGDLYKNLAFSAFLFLIIFYLAGHLPAAIFEDVNILQTPHSTIVLLLLVSSPLGFWFMPLFGFLSRHNEYAADCFGAEMEDRASLANALVSLVNENRSFPHSHPAYIFFYYTHPPLVQRLEALGYFESSSEES